ncbi:acyl-CoA thioesterase-1 [Sphingomonas sp. PP-F2F-A104-K0414]|uniref:arylesterase n=1 Tax=Sphingomonas sp. PP-F2F-A104-K0414 TaxID=2135661 RepID=UPI0010D1E55C|nr:arylesterase [Sphingomonas sp. PP-F2F-A104-K0414]TCP98464.1 acyl-CoA thioesterase-1 [Sphingomonas sp. PP-F2F-A104-K0414]
METTILEKQMRRWPLYGGGLALLQAGLLAGCDRTPEVPAPLPTTNAVSPAAATPAPQSPERLILAFGDSLYAGYGLDRGQSLPDALQNRLRKDGVNATIINAGVSGDTSAAGRQRFAFALDNMKRKPDLIMLGLGGNDVLRQISPTETRANMTAMMDEAKRRGIPVMLTGMMAPPNLGPDFAVQFNGIWPDLATRYNATLYPFILDGVIGKAQLMQADHVHPNRNGVDRIAARVAPVIMTTLKNTE